MKKKIRFLNILAFLIVNVLIAQHDTSTGFDFIVNEDGVWTW